MSEEIKKEKVEEVVEKPKEVETVKEEIKVEPMKEEKSNKAFGTLLIMLTVVLFLTAGSLLCALLVKEGILKLPTININFDGKTADTKTEDTKADDATPPKIETPTTTLTTGKYVTAQVPETWTVKEYYNGQGTDSLPSGTTYTGLTGLIISHGTNKVFTLKAVSGIGFQGCPSYAVFEDNSAGYQQDMANLNTEIGMNMETTNYVGTTYSEFEWLNTTFRRIGKLYFYDTKEGNNYFEAPCVSGLISLSGLSFKDAHNYKGYSYFFGATTTATEEELLVVDQILGSMKLVQ